MDLLNEMIKLIPASVQPWLTVIGALCTLATAIATATPTKKDDEIKTWADKIGRLADRIGIQIKRPK